MDFLEEGKRLLGRVSFTVLTGMFFMDWFAVDMIEVTTGVALSIGFIGEKRKDSGYDWTDYDWNQKDPFEVELLGYGCIVLIVYWHFFLIFYSLAADFYPPNNWSFGRDFNSWDVIKAKLSFLKK
ncbi:hypothetical protein CDAR_615351 [Caerostris darwini]|uniref:Uncharacterized protein n=1 Tax=Caerostris darwini TaxID=1538125 RepID=A0AAV4RW46_9ARAC|nr:hypothetical protein CDAR_615351 [Caerostris darwini]